MEIKILQVFLGADGLPYKDQERKVHFPIVGSGFQGASNTTKIRFYYDELVEQDDTETAWVACAKLPNGKIGSKVLETDYDSTLGEHYALLELDSFYFQYKGDVYISLQGYQGGVQVDYDEETELYTIYGTPTIASTGSIKLSVNYATQFVGSGETSNVNFQRILADLGTKLGIRANTLFVEELPTVGNPDTFYVIHNDLSDPNKANIYIWNSVTEHYIWVGDNSLDLGNYYTQEEGQALEDKINAAASGSPKGVYATVSDLETADPDHDYIYVVTGTGNWYYWDSGTSAWVSGGDYLSGPNDSDFDQTSTNALENKVISKYLAGENIKAPNILGDDTFEFVGENLIAEDTTWTDGKYLDGNNNEGTSATSSYTDYIYVPAGCSVFYNGIFDSPSACIYSKNGNTYTFISSIGKYGGTSIEPAFLGTSTIWVSSGVYLRFNFETAKKGIAKAIPHYSYNEYRKELKWLKVKPNNIENEYINIKQNISQSDGTPIVSFMPNHMWKKNGTLFTTNATFGSTVTIPLNNAQRLTILPLYKYNQEGTIDNGAFVDKDGNYVAGLMANATWNEEHTLLLVSSIPNGAYGIQLNATTSEGKYSISDSGLVIASSTIYIVLENSQYSPKWLIVDTNNIKDESVTMDKLSSEVQALIQEPETVEYKYWDSLKKPFDFQSHTLVGFGDSITAGVYNEGDGNHTTYTDSYITLFATKFGMLFYNRAVSGSCITSGVNAQTPICDKIDDYTFANANTEFIIIAGGTNDFNSGATLGHLGDTATTTFYGALNHICQRLTTYAPNSTVIFITPINLNKEESSFPNHINPLNAYRNAIWEVATKYGFNVVDGSTIGFDKEVNTSWGNLMIAPSDGTHPTLAGHALYFRGLCGKLK